MKKILIMIPLAVFLLTGCYDMTDIKNIETVTSVCVEPGKITYCTVTTIPGEKNYGFRMYAEDTEDLYRGLDAISKKSGKEIGVSHLNSIIFSKECDLALIKSVCDAAVSGTDFHPKIMTAFTDMSIEAFFDNMSIPEDTVLYRHIADIFRDKYTLVTECTLIELSRALHFETLGVNLPVFTLDSAGNIIPDGICHISCDKSSFFGTDFANTVNLVKHPGKTVYYTMGDTSIPVKLNDVKMIFDKNKNHINIQLKAETDGRNTDTGTLKRIKEKLTSDIIKICNEKNTGFDMLGLTGAIPKEFFTEKELRNYIESHGGFYTMLNKMDFDVETEVLGGKK